jgi:thymidine kinase
MFIEPKNRKGWIEVICGSMFSGKTEELIRRVRRAEIANQKIALFKPDIEKRYHNQNIVSHNNLSITAMAVSSVIDILNHSKVHDVIGIDEAQFFNPDILQVCNNLANDGKRVIIAGLDLDYLAQPFGPMPQLIASAEYVTKVHAICSQCGSLAQYTYKLSKKGSTIELGEKDKYEARCRPCYVKGMGV